MLTVEKIDWNRAWKEDRKTSMKTHDQEFWNRRAASFAQHVRQNDGEDYVDPFLRILDAQPEWSVLDVGCGPGTLACPLAKIVRQVTAIDFSPAMISFLQERKKTEGFRNLTVQLAQWEDDWEAIGIQPHDVAIASRSLGSDDPRAMLTKLNSYAKQRVYISCAVGDGPSDHRVLEAAGRETHSNPDYIYIYNMLHQMGIYANVIMIEKNPRSFADKEEAVDSVRWMLEKTTSTEEEALRRFISAQLVSDGERWKLGFQRPVRWAVIWWNVEQQARELLSR